MLLQLIFIKTYLFKLANLEIKIFFTGGDSKTVMFVQISPVKKNSSETSCSLNFAQRVRAVELGQANKKQIDIPN